VAVPNTFADKTLSVGLSDLDDNFTYLDNAISNNTTITAFTYLASNGSSITTAEASVFPNKKVLLEANSIYQIEWNVYFVKTTSSTTTWRLNTTNSANTSNIHPQLVNFTAEGHINQTTNGTSGTSTGGSFISGSISPFSIVTPSVTDTNISILNIKAFLISNTTTSSYCYLSAFNASGSFIPRIGSHFIVTKLPTSDLGSLS
jgi:hypothetical protein